MLLTLMAVSLWISAAATRRSRPSTTLHSRPSQTHIRTTTGIATTATPTTATRLSAPFQLPPPFPSSPQLHRPHRAEAPDLALVSYRLLSLPFAETRARERAPLPSQAPARVSPGGRQTARRTALSRRRSAEERALFFPSRGSRPARSGNCVLACVASSSRRLATLASHAMVASLRTLVSGKFPALVSISRISVTS